jgi:RNA recognition motif-containing protein
MYLMVKTIYVGNLPFSSTSSDVGEMFGAYGSVHSVNLINDRETGRPRGFGFVEMDDEPALTAIEALNGTELGGRSLRINEARGREDRPSGGGDRRPRRSDY